MKPLFFWMRGMSISESDALVSDVRFDAEAMSVVLSDGRTIRVPLAWYPRLLNADSTIRSHWQPAAAGRGIHWPELDEDLSIEGLLKGTPSPEYRH